MQQKVQKLKDSLDPLRKQKKVPEPTYTLFLSVKGYQQPLEPIQAAYNLWATLDYIFITSTWSELLGNRGLVKDHLLSSALTLQKDELVTDEFTAEIAKIFQDFFSEAKQLSFSARKGLDNSLGGDGVEIFNRLSAVFGMAERGYRLKQLEQQLRNREEQIINSSVPPTQELNQFYKSAVRLLPNDQQLNLTGNVDEAFVKEYQKQWDAYIQSISALNTDCFNSEGLAPFGEKFLNERKACIASINALTQRLNELPAKWLAQQQKMEIEKEKAEQAQSSEALPKHPLQEEKTTVSFPDITSLQEQIAQLENQLTTSKDEYQKLKEKKTSLETESAQLAQSLSKSDNLGKEQEELIKQLSKVTQLKTEIESDKLNNNATADEFTIALLNTEKETLEIYLQQQAEKTGWIAWGWGVLQWAAGTATSFSYTEQKEQFIQTLNEKINSEKEKQIQLTKAIEQREIDEAKLTQLNNKLALLITSMEEQEALKADLKEKQTNLQATLQQTQKEYFNDAKQTLMDSVGIALITTQENSSASSMSPEADLPEITKSQQTEDLTLQEKKKKELKEELDNVETRLDSLLDAPSLDIILIIVAFAAYLKALLDYYTEIDVRASLRQFKTEVKSIFTSAPFGSVFSKPTDKTDSADKAAKENVQQPESEIQPPHKLKNTP